MMTDEQKTAEIRRLNDAFRKSFFGGRVVTTRRVASLDPLILRCLIKAIMEFDDFTEDNDPYGEHDLFAQVCDGEKYFVKIDYYAMEGGVPDLDYGSAEPWDSKKTFRVMTIMHASEY